MNSRQKSVVFITFAVFAIEAVCTHALGKASNLPGKVSLYALTPGFVDLLKIFVVVAFFSILNATLVSYFNESEKDLSKT